MTALQRFLSEAGGVVTVEAFMRWALHDPQHGYYARRIGDVGRTGDFSTSATISNALAHAIAAWAKAHRAEVDQRGRWHLVEIGPGNGRIAAEILRALGSWTCAHVTYHLVETSAPLVARQREALAHWGRGPFAPQLCWHPDVESALRAANGAALIFSNELVDAFPCAVLVRASAGADWREVALQWDETSKRPAEMIIDLSSERAAAALPGVLALPPDAARIEVHLAYCDWLQRWRGAWTKGRMLTIDYGGPVETLYHRRPKGTLRGYFRQQRMDGGEIYERAGHQDLTADVNFTDLIRWGESLGLTTSAVLTQRDFILEWNPGTDLRDAATAQLLNPDGAGQAFKVLEQMVPI